MDQTKEVIDQFESAFQTHDATAFARIVADDCVLENTGPAPDGARYVGHDACVKFWSSIATAPNHRFEEESVDIYGERAIICWRLFFGKGKANSVRGVNIMRVQNGKIVEGLGYVKA